MVRAARSTAVAPSSIGDAAMEGAEAERDEAVEANDAAGIGSASKTRETATRAYNDASARPRL